MKKSFESEPILSLEEQKANLHDKQMENSPEKLLKSPEPIKREHDRNFYSAGRKFSSANK